MANYTYTTRMHMFNGEELDIFNSLEAENAEDAHKKIHATAEMWHGAPLTSTDEEGSITYEWRLQGVTIGAIREESSKDATARRYEECVARLDAMGAVPVE